MLGDVVFTWSCFHFKCNWGSLRRKGDWILSRQLGVHARVTRPRIKSHGQIQELGDGASFLLLILLISKFPSYKMKAIFFLVPERMSFFEESFKCDSYFLNIFFK